MANQVNLKVLKQELRALVERLASTSDASPTCEKEADNEARISINGAANTDKAKGTTEAMNTSGSTIAIIAADAREAAKADGVIDANGALNIKESNSIPLDFKSLERDLTNLAQRLRSADIDPSSRHALQKAAQKVSLSLETPGNTLSRISYLPLQLTVVRIGVDLELFDKLEKAGSKGLGAEELAMETKADVVLLTRILRYLAVAGVVDEQLGGKYVANHITIGLNTETSLAGIKHYNDVVTRALYVLPEYFAQTHYQNPTDPYDCPFQMAFRTKQHGFEWYRENPVAMANFQTWLKGSHADRVDWLDWFPFWEEIVKGFEGGSDAVLVVDVGGSHGSELLKIRHKYPSAPGRLILQDMREVIERAQKTEVFEATAHDFFEPQPIKGARLYYFRNVLHDWLDAKAQEILKQTKDAMKRGYSKIIINEVVVHATDADWTETQWDLTMMSLMASMERTETQWRNLLASVGLENVKVWRNTRAVESIIEVELDPDSADSGNRIPVGLEGMGGETTAKLNGLCETDDCEDLEEHGGN